MRTARKCSVSKRGSFGFYQNKFSEFPYLCKSIGLFLPPWPPEGSPAQSLASVPTFWEEEGSQEGGGGTSKVRQEPPQ